MDRINTMAEVLVQRGCEQIFSQAAPGAVLSPTGDFDLLQGAPLQPLKPAEIRWAAPTFGWPA
jgi:hypothetical protein